MSELLQQFRDLKLSKEVLIDKMNLQNPTIQPVTVSSHHLICLLESYRNSKINLTLDWVNTIWFTDFFVYNDDQENSIASVMSELEEFDECDKNLSADLIDKFIFALENNIET